MKGFNEDFLSKYRQEKSKNFALRDISRDVLLSSL